MSLSLTFISDTHGQEPNLPGGDILVHCGDLSEHGFRVEVIKTLNYLHEQLDKYKHVIVIPGNHDLYAERHPIEFKKACALAGLSCLINESISLLGLNFWGSPYTPYYHNWAFNLPSQDLQILWKRIPQNCNVIITHGPPKNILDLSAKGDHLGCPHLLSEVLRVNPKIHAFGHVHESCGQSQIGQTLFINSATGIVNISYP